MKISVIGLTLILTSAVPVLAADPPACTAPQAQIEAEANRRLDGGAFDAKILLQQAAKLCAEKKDAEAQETYTKAAQAAGMAKPQATK